jgi:hypothetical protein
VGPFLDPEIIAIAFEVAYNGASELSQWHEACVGRIDNCFVKVLSIPQDDSWSVTGIHTFCSCLNTSTGNNPANAGDNDLLLLYSIIL